MYTSLSNNHLLLLLSHVEMMCNQYLFSVSAACLSHVLLLLVHVPLIVFLHYGLYVDVSLPLSQLVALGKNNIHY